MTRQETDQEQQSQQAEEQFWEQSDAAWESDEPVMVQKKQNMTRFVIIKLLTILFVLYIAWSYRSDLTYFFSSKKAVALPTVTIDTEDKINFEKWQHHNQYVSVKGWIKLDQSFAVKIGFSRYDILKLWHLPVFIAIKQGEKGLVKSRISAAVPMLTSSGRFLNYRQALVEGGLFTPYDAIGKGYFRITKKRLPKNTVIIMGNQSPGKDYTTLIILGLMLLYLIYSGYNILRLFKLFKQNNQQV